MNNLDMYNKYANPPEDAKKKITGGRLNGMTDINPMWRIRCLTEEYGECGFGWYVEVKEHWTEPQDSGEVGMFVRLHLFVKRGDQWSMPIEGCGGSRLIASEKSGLRLNDEAYKMAETDALGVACKKLGIGANVYWSANDSKHTKSEPVDRNQKKVQEVLCADCGNMIQPVAINGKKYSIKDLVDGSIKSYGVPLCGSCSLHRKVRGA